MTNWDNWRPGGWNAAQTYLLLHEGTDVEALNRELPEFLGRSVQNAEAIDLTYHLQPLSRLHLYSNMDYGITRYGDISHIYLLVAIGLLILTVACINFMNLSTARSVWPHKF